MDSEQVSINTTKLILSFNPHVTVRIRTSTASHLLLQNESVKVQGEKRYFVMKDLGLGVCEIGLRAPGKINSYMAQDKEWNKERKWVKTEH